MARQLFALGATERPQRFTWTPSPLQLTPAATLQGGTALGAAAAAMEAASGRPLHSRIRRPGG